MKVRTASQRPTHRRDATTSSQTRISPLLRLPRELRDAVYKFFISVDQHFKWDEEDIPFNSPVLQINRQIRQEALDCFIKSNVWIRITVPYKPDYYWFPKAGLLPHKVPIKYWDRLGSAVAVHFHLTGERATNKEYTYTFAYHPFTYGLFVHEVSRSHGEYPVLGVQVNRAVSQRPLLFAKLIQPLYSIRNFQGVVIRGIQDDTTRHALVHQIRRPSNTIEDLVAIKECYQAMGRRAELDGRHSDAMTSYLLGIEATWDLADQFIQGSPQDNSLHHMNSDCFIAYSRNTHKHITILKARAPPVAVIETATRDLLLEIIGASSHALAFPGVTDRQRCEAYLYRAFAFYHYAECQNPFLDRDGIDHLDRERASVSPCRVNHGDCYLHAARSLFYARQVDCWQAVLAGLNEDDGRVLDVIQARPGPQAFQLQERQFPLVGSWRGDPDLLNGWQRHEIILMALFRRRHNQGPDGDVGVPPDLTSEYQEHGIFWSYSGTQLGTVQHPAHLVL